MGAHTGHFSRRGEWANRPPGQLSYRRDRGDVPDTNRRGIVVATAHQSSKVEVEEAQVLMINRGAVRQRS
eukprot:s700_g21.t1